MENLYVVTYLTGNCRDAVEVHKVPSLDEQTQMVETEDLFISKMVMATDRGKRFLQEVALSAFKLGRSRERQYLVRRGVKLPEESGDDIPF